MTSYDKQYQVEQNLFGTPYIEFETFVREHAQPGGTALDLGCGQGRDALMLAQYGYTVTGVDTSSVGIEQMVERAKAKGLAVNGVVADFYEYELVENFDAIVLDSILHFGKADKAKELALLDRVTVHLRKNGYLFLFVHKSREKERVLKSWFNGQKSCFALLKDSYIDYVYHEKATGFQSSFQYCMLILRRVMGND